MIERKTLWTTEGPGWMANIILPNLLYVFTFLFPSEEQMMLECALSLAPAVFLNTSQPWKKVKDLVIGTIENLLGVWMSVWKNMSVLWENSTLVWVVSHSILHRASLNAPPPVWFLPADCVNYFAFFSLYESCEKSPSPPPPPPPPPSCSSLHHNPHNYH